ncbi:MAG TPA: ComEC/Rec2 family competence protein, partial [Gammaproteobacteria bacterium]|nr:ComEC/Rec2 family competence protein [Gammaproteobacteria bacterium]
NLVAIPVFSIVLVPLVLIGVFRQLSWGTPDFLWNAGGWLANAVMAGLAAVARIPAAGFAVTPPSLHAALLAVIGVALTLAWHPGRGRPIGALALLPLLYPGQHSLPDAAFRLTVLDAGHGLATVIETRNHRLVYDTGARFASGFDIGRDIVLPVLRARGDPDMLVVSHADNDHSGGMTALIAAYPELTVLAGPDVEHAGGWVCAAGQRWRLDNVEFELLHPRAGFVGSGNDGSCVLRITAPGGSALLTGDIERAGEAAVIARGNTDVDIVVAPHHGSATSSSPAFVAATSPRIAVFSAGFGNRWNFPVTEVVARWCEAGAAVYVTGEHGAIEIEVGTDASGAVARRNVRRRYWNPGATPRCGESPTVTL